MSTKCYTTSLRSLYAGFHSENAAKDKPSKQASSWCLYVHVLDFAFSIILVVDCLSAVQASIELVEMTEMQGLWCRAESQSLEQ